MNEYLNRIHVYFTAWCNAFSQILLDVLEAAFGGGYMWFAVLGLMTVEDVPDISLLLRVESVSGVSFNKVLKDLDFFGVWFIIIQKCHDKFLVFIFYLTQGFTNQSLTNARIFNIDSQIL